MSRNILVSDLSKEVANQLDKIKKQEEIKTDTKAVLYLIENWQRMKDELEVVRSQRDEYRGQSINQLEVLESLHNANKSLEAIMKKR